MTVLFNEQGQTDAQYGKHIFPCCCYFGCSTKACQHLTLSPGNACHGGGAGQEHKMVMRSDWDAVKIEIMYRCLSMHKRNVLHFFSSSHPSSPSFRSPPPPPNFPLLHYLHTIRVNLAKYVANPALQAQLLSTGQENLIGCWSTGWTTAGVTRSFYQTASLL